MSMRSYAAGSRIIEGRQSNRYVADCIQKGLFIHCSICVVTKDSEKPDGSEIVMYQTDDGSTKIDVHLDDEAVWLSQAQMADLFQTTKQNISLHINNAFAEGELDPSSTVKEYLTVQNEGGREVSRSVKHYNLDVIISVGYRVKSLRGVQFRRWATGILREYLLKGFSMNDDLLKKAGGGNYWHELLERIRDIRSSEKVFCRHSRTSYSYLKVRANKKQSGRPNIHEAERRAKSILELRAHTESAICPEIPNV